VWRVNTTWLAAPFYLRADAWEMKLRTLLTTFALALVITAGLAGPTARPAQASCGITPPLPRVLATAPVVFVGKVIATRNHSMTAEVRVQDVWRGNHVPKIAEVDNDSPEDFRLFRKGVIYLFIPEAISLLSPYQDNACSATRRYSHALAQYRPRNAHRP
jgi:hypothetical protein